MAALTFELQARDTGSKARAGIIRTDHGEIRTPIFMPVGTVGSVKAVTQQQLRHDVQAQIILGNTYHLYLRPGLQVLEAAGGFINSTDGRGRFLQIAVAIRCFRWRVPARSGKKASPFSRI